MGSLSNMFNGGQSQGFGDLISQLQAAIGQTNANYKPYMDAGSAAIPQFQDFLKNIQGQMNGNWMNSYQESPYAKYLTGKETNAMNNAAAAGGLLGSGANQQDVGTLANNITAGDMQNYFNNMQSQNSMYGSGLGSLMGQGLNATNSDTNLVDSLMGGIGNAQFGLDQANQKSKNDKTGIIGDMMGIPINAMPGGPGSENMPGLSGKSKGGAGGVMGGNYGGGASSSNGDYSYTNSAGGGGEGGGGGSGGGGGGGGDAAGSDMSSIASLLPLLMMFA